MQEHGPFHGISRERRVLALAFGGMGRDGERHRLRHLPRRHYVDERALLHPIGRDLPRGKGESCRRGGGGVEEDTDPGKTLLAPPRPPTKTLRARPPPPPGGGGRGGGGEVAENDAG